MSVKQARERINLLKARGAKVVMMSGSFDVLHAGHVWILEQARQQGDALFLLLNSDVSVRSYKGPTRPIIPERERALMLGAFASVDGVIMFDEPTPLSILKTLHPDVYCNGSDYGPECIEKGVVEENGGRIHIIERIPGFSTTLLLERIRASYS